MFNKQALKKLIIPLIIEQFLAVMVGMADIMMVSSAGEAAVSSVALVDLINVLIINVFSALATGGAVVCAQSIGAEHLDRANRDAIIQAALADKCTAANPRVPTVADVSAILDAVSGEKRGI